MLNIYVTSTEENKSRYLIITGILALMQSLGYSVCLYKPVQMDGFVKDDEFHSKEFDYIMKTDSFINIKTSYLFQTATNPLIASVKEGKLIDKDNILEDFKNIIDINECTIVEGLNGFGTPLCADFLEIDMIRDLNLPVILVVSAIKDSLNNILAALNNAQTNGISVRGVIISDYPDNIEDDNIKYLPRFIEEYSCAKVFGVLPKINELIPPEELIDLILNSIDIEAVFDVAILKLEK